VPKIHAFCNAKYVVINKDWSQKAMASLEQEQEELEVDQRYTTETISNCCCLVLFYKDITEIPEDIYKPFELTRVTFYRYTKIFDNHTDAEIKNMGIKK